MKRTIFGILTVILALICGCSNNLNVYTQYKETTIVYGLLDQKDTATYIKINKAFLGPGNALQIAQVYDSISYANQLTVQLQQINQGTLVKTINLTRDSSIAKPPGIFSSPKQILYKTKAPLDSSCQYNLIVTNNVTHNQVTGSTLLINGLTITAPNRAGSLNFTSPTYPVSIVWQTATNGFIYGVTIRFYYVEQNIATGVQTTKSLDWIFVDQIAQSTTVSEQMSLTIKSPSFFQFLHSHLQPDPTVRRYLQQSPVNHDADIIFSVGGQDLNTYLEVSQPSSGIVQSQPQYTDIKNGFGLFSCRFVTAMTGFTLGPDTQDSLYTGQYTGNLFCNPIPGQPGSCQ